MGGGERKRVWNAAALAWGFAEATVFFIVPDVLLTVLALRGPRRALAAVPFALAGAVAGGLAMRGFAAIDPAAALRLLEAIPGVTPAVIERARGLAGMGLLRGMTLGSLSGVPYKIFAVEAGAAGVPAAAFAAASVAARGLRFVLAILATALLARTLFRRFGEEGRFAVLTLFWVGLYAVYFALIGW